MIIGVGNDPILPKAVRFRFVLRKALFHNKNRRDLAPQILWSTSLEDGQPWIPNQESLKQPSIFFKPVLAIQRLVLM